MPKYKIHCEDNFTYTIIGDRIEADFDCCFHDLRFTVYKKTKEMKLVQDRKFFNLFKVGEPYLKQFVDYEIIGVIEKCLYYEILAD